MRTLPTVVARLIDRNPQVSTARLLEQLRPPPHFSSVTFDTYVPAAEEPTQGAAVAALRAFVARASPAQGRSSQRRGARRWLSGGAPPEDRPGVYLDGGFGVGKTHLLASTWHAWPGRAAFGTFVEYTHLVGALGFATAVDMLCGYQLICIDEFELDDPGDTVLMASLLGRLVDAGVALAATSNTLPDRLGEGRFAAEDFLREIQRLSASFEVVRIDGADYRHRGLAQAPEPLSEEVLRVRAEEAGDEAVVTLDDFRQLQVHLSTLHPSRYGALVDGIGAVHLQDVRTLTDQVEALRTVVLIDRLYDRGITVVASGVKLDRLFSDSMLAGGYRKKYRRALSRILVLARDGDTDT